MSVSVNTPSYGLENSIQSNRLKKMPSVDIQKRKSDKTNSNMDRGISDDIIQIPEKFLSMFEQLEITDPHVIKSFIQDLNKSNPGMVISPEVAKRALKGLKIIDDMSKKPNQYNLDDFNIAQKDPSLKELDKAILLNTQKIIALKGASDIVTPNETSSKSKTEKHDMRIVFFNDDIEKIMQNPDQVFKVGADILPESVVNLINQTAAQLQGIPQGKVNGDLNSLPKASKDDVDKINQEMANHLITYYKLMQIRSLALIGSNNKSSEQALAAQANFPGHAPMA